ncbi:MAG: LysM peptidoglycan-binding domain-containing protein [Phycisphaerales bacterium]|nr:MAG: LysM peptidoglycan-binding domain-containing protein [Phycisphaerales bacterium]
MRPDVKLGIVISMVVVLVAGTYYLYRDKGDTPVQLASGPESLPDPAATETPSRPPAAADGAQGVRPGPDRAQGSGSRQRVAEPDARTAGRGSGPPRPRAGRPTEDSIAGKTPTPTDVPTTTGEGERSTGSAPNREISAGQPELADTAPDRIGEGATSDRPASSGAVARLDRAAQREFAGRTRPSATRSRRPVPLAAAKRQAGGDAADRPTIGREAAVETHRIQPGDTFSLLAERYYGSARLTRFLIDSNPQISDPNRLRVGTIVRIPPRPSDETLRRATSTAKPSATSAEGERRTYAVQPGDSFYAIARDVLGNPARWRELFELNKELVHGDPTRLQVGQVIVLPNP